MPRSCIAASADKQLRSAMALGWVDDNSVPDHGRAAAKDKYAVSQRRNVCRIVTDQECRQMALLQYLAQRFRR